MPRPRRCRRVCMEPAYDRFTPCGKPDAQSVVLTVDEYEVIRLVDYEKQTHEQCARQMDISRTTVTEIYESARFKLADSIVNGKAVVIGGGNYRICSGAPETECGRRCRRAGRMECPGQAKKEGEVTMRIAVTYEDGMVFQHFGHTAQMKIYDIENGAVVNETVVDTTGSGHGALAGFLTGMKVDTLICGGIGAGAQNALAEAGITLYGGVSGSADEAVKALLAGNLEYNPNVHCDHHGHGHHGDGCHGGGHHDGDCHGHGHHGQGHCGEDKHGCAGN